MHSAPDRREACLDQERPPPSANGKWKGEVTNQEHSPTFGARLVWERKVVTIGFTGTHTDESAEGDGMALAGKQSIRFKSRLRLLIPD